MDHTQAVRDLAFAPDGSLRLVSASLDRTIKVRSASTFFFKHVYLASIVQEKTTVCITYEPVSSS